jgi:hypothetical protein
MYSLHAHYCVKNAVLSLWNVNIHFSYICNSLTRITKSVHFNGRKHFYMWPTYRKRNSPIYLHMLQAFSCVGGCQGCRMSEYGRQEQRGLFVHWTMTEHNQLCCAAEFLHHIQNVPTSGEQHQAVVWHMPVHHNTPRMTKPFRKTVVCVREAILTHPP